MPSDVVSAPVQFALSPKSNHETCFNNCSAKIFGVKPGFSTLGVEVASTTSSPTVSSDAGVASPSATARLERVRGLFSSATVVSSFFSGAAVVSSFFSGAAVVSSAFSGAAVVSSFFSAAAVVSSVFSAGVTPSAAVVASGFSTATS